MDSFTGYAMIFGFPQYGGGSVFVLEKVYYTAAALSLFIFNLKLSLIIRVVRSLLNYSHHLYIYLVLLYAHYYKIVVVILVVGNATIYYIYPLQK